MSLQPRTPHSSRGGQQRFIDDGADEVDLLQSFPLLASSATATFSAEVHQQPLSTHIPPSKPKRGGCIQQILAKVPPALGIVCALILLFLIVLSYKKPDMLLHAIGDVPNAHSLVIDYSKYTTFPLKPDEYLNECWKHLGTFPHTHSGYWTAPHSGFADVKHKMEAGVGGVCSSTITYMLDGSFGLFLELSFIAQLSGLAREQNRTFFIDDRNWNRGRWIDHFVDVRKTQPGPEPGCLPPPVEELVACPRHWVMNAKTAKFHFGHMFADEFEDPYSISIQRQKPIFKRAEKSFRDTIIPEETNRRFIQDARDELFAKIKGAYIGIHIRRGDGLPTSWRWNKDFVPISVYVEEAAAAWKRLFPGTSSGSPIVYIATDSTSALQDYLNSAPNSGNVFGLFKSDNERLKGLASPHGYYQDEWSRVRTNEERIRFTRGVIVDFALLSGAWLAPAQRPSLAVICTMSICNMAAVALGWDRAIDMDYWIDLDNRKRVEPGWNAFHLQ